MWPYYSYYIIVVTFFLFIITMKSIYKDSDFIFGIFFVIAVGFFWGARSEYVGTDTIPVYKAWFTSSTTYITQLKNGSKEAGFVLFSLIIKLLSIDNYRIYMLSVSFVVAILWFFAFRSNKFFPIAGFAYMVTQHFFITSCTNIIRQGIAMALGGLAITFLFNNKKAYFFALVILAVFFHYSAILLLMYFVFSKIRISPFLSIVFVALAICLIFFPSTDTVSNVYTIIVKQLPLPNVIKWRAINYLKNQNNAIISYGFFLSLAVTIFLIILRGKIEANNAIQSRILINGMLFYVLISILFSFNEVLFRLTMYFYIVEFLAIPVILYSLFEIIPRYKMAILVLFISFLMLSSMKTIYSLRGTKFMEPYFS